MFVTLDSLVSLHILVLLSMLTTCRLTCHTQSLMLFLATQMLFLATHIAITTKHHLTLKPLLHTSAPISNIKGGRVGFENSCNSIEHKASQAREGRPLYRTTPAPPLQHLEPSWSFPHILRETSAHLPRTFHDQQPSRLHSLYDPFLSETLVSTTKTTFSTGVEKWSFASHNLKET